LKEGMAVTPKVVTAGSSAMRWGVVLALFIPLMFMLRGGRSGEETVVPQQEAPDHEPHHVGGSAAVESERTLAAATSGVSALADRFRVSPQCVNTSFHAWVTRALNHHFGPAISQAVYDPELYNLMVRSVETDGDGAWWWPNDDKVPFKTVDTAPTRPTHFYNISNLLWWTKRWTTIAISKVSRDSELEILFERLCVDPAHNMKMGLLEKTVLRTLSAQVHYFHTVLQLGIDVCNSPDVNGALYDLVKAHKGMDSLVLISGWIQPSTSISDIDALFDTHDKTTLQLAAVVRGRLETVMAAATALKAAGVKTYAESLYPLYYDGPAYLSSNPLDGKFWNMLRPTAGCSSIIRMCEVPDGCRLVCNAEYLLYAGRTEVSSQPYHHRMIGMGGNNEYEWEMSLLTFFEGSTALSRGDAHQLGWLTSMDCTLTVTPGKRKWNVPKALRKAAIGFSGISLCAAGKKIAPYLVAPGGLKELQLSSETTWGDVNPPLTLRFSKNPGAVSAAKRRRGRSTEDQSFTMAPRTTLSSPRTPVVGPRWFDALTVFKMDIEGWEWSYVPAWLREECHSIATNAKDAVQAHSTAAIDFAAAVPQHFTVSLFGLEFHRIGHTKSSGATNTGALRAHWLTLQLYSLGFIMVGHEKNEMDQCCFEHAYVHVRHFIKSEMWMLLRDEI
jgi:hypothetical protein